MNYPVTIGKGTLYWWHQVNLGETVHQLSAQRSKSCVP